MKLNAAFITSALTLLGGFSPAHADDVETVGTPGLTLYSMPNLGGRSVQIARDTPKLKPLGFAGTAMSMKVTGGQWEVCDGNQYRGTCEVFGPGEYHFGLFNWGNKIKSVHRVRRGTALITLFAGANMQGKSHTYANTMPRIKDFATNDFAHSAKVTGGEWVLCADSGGKGKCETIRRDVPRLATIGLAGSISSLYRAADWRDSSLSGGEYGSDGYTDGSGGAGYNNGYGRNNRRPQITLYAGTDFTGARMTLDGSEADLRNSSFSNTALSAQVLGGVWELCDGANFTKTCKTIDRDEPDLGNIYLSYLVTSLRPIEGGRTGDGRRDDGRRADLGRNGVEGLRTVFFPEPTYRNEAVASCLYNNTQCGAEAADAFCRESGLRQSVYFDEANSYRPPYLLGEGRIARRSSQTRLVDVLCRR